ncbi:MAG TPA: choice-of-anchor tandem repeat GloVer-containing protein [Vicinamibacterales bacterium]|nr:choice-of-anchor tandem repeat GloVer-containing protein [Vicinamibacterales bacterium]
MKVARVLSAALLTLLAAARPAAQPPAPPTTVHRFAAPVRAGLAPLTEAPDGRLFGILEQGGAGDRGAVYMLTPDGSGGYTFDLLHVFNGADGQKPMGLTYSPADGLLYGTTQHGGLVGGLPLGNGTVFSLDPAAPAVTTLRVFAFDFANPQPLQPQAGLVEGSDGAFYGTGSAASTSPGLGAIFKIDRSGNMETLWTFSGANGSTPASTLVEGSDGFLYGTTAFGGANDAGTVFRIDKTGSGFETLHDFTGPAGSTQPRGLMRDTAGGADIFYGVTGGGGAQDMGSVFSITPDGTFATVASFVLDAGAPRQGAYPNGPLVKGPDGLLYGTTESGGPIPFSSRGVVFSLDPATGALTVAHDYNSDPGTGLTTNAGLFRAADGSLFGTTLNGGAHRVGTVYRVDVSGGAPAVSKAIDFPSLGPSTANDRMILASDGHLYGTTVAGGEYNGGTIFRVANGVVTTLHSFNFADGYQPSGELVQGSDGYLYGTTRYGGPALSPADLGAGTVFRISLAGTLTTLHTFTAGSGPAVPLAGLVEGPDGNFYGTSFYGPSGPGTVFRMTPAGAVTTLHEFNTSDGWGPTPSSLVLGHDGFFYGVTREGGVNPNYGVAYKIDRDGNFTLIHQFDDTEGGHPGGLTLLPDGNFLGVTEAGAFPGTATFGTLFRMTPAGDVTVLHRFNRDIDGSMAAAPPLAAGDGNFYGTTVFGGDLPGFVQGLGTLYRYDSGGFSLLHVFGSVADEGGTPSAGVQQGSDNLLYGSTLNLPGGTLYSLNAGIANRSPIARHQRVSIGPGDIANVTIDASDPDGNPLAFTIVGQPAHGTVSGSGPSFQYQPNSGFSGTDVFHVRATDGTASSAVAGVMITVGGTNTAPIAYDQTLATPEEIGFTVSLLTFDAENNPLSFTLLTQPAHGTLSGAAPDFIYTPAANYYGPDGFTFKVNDGSLDSNVATISITVDPVNDPPVALDQTVTSNGGSPVPIVLGALDADGDPLLYYIGDAPLNGGLTGAAPNLTYTPNAGFTGTDTFTFYANDGTAIGSVATVTINVTAPNGAPTAQDQSVIVRHDTPTPIALAASDPEGDALTYVNVTLPAHGVLSGSAPNYTYTPAADYSGPDSFTFKVNDGTSDSNVAAVTITVRPLDRAPISNPGGPYTTDLGAPVTFDGTGSSDPDEIYGDSIVQYTWSAGGVHLASGPTPTISASDIMTKLGSGSFSITLRVTDASGFSTNADTPLTVRRPTADFSVAPNPAACGVAMTFDATAAATARSTRTIVSYVYDFGDGTSASTGVLTQHTYAGYGNYAAQLTVTDDLGIAASRTQPVSIHPGHPPAANPGGPYAATIGGGVTFDGRGSSDPNTACGDSIATYQWLVNGTIVLAGPTPSLSAAQIAALGPGTFAVQLSVLDTLGGGDTASTSLTIQPLTIGTITTVTASAGTIGSLEPLSIIATVAPAAGTAVPAGEVEFLLNGTIVIGIAPLVNGVATLRANGGMTGGTYTVTARYAGTGTFTGSTSAPLPLTVRPLNESSFTLLLPWTNPQALGSAVVVSALVVPLPGGPPAAGTVEFFDGGVLIGSASLSGGLATLSFTPVVAGPHTLSARYLGSAALAPSTSPPVHITIFAGGTAPAATTTTLSSGPSPGTLGQPVTFTATVSPGAPSGGTVRFFVDGVAAGTAPVVGGTATFTTAALPVGVRVATASYGGAAGLAASNSSVVLLVITP